MANTLYRRLPNGDWMRQDGGGPAYFRVARNSDDGQWYAYFTYDGTTYMPHANPQATVAGMQTALDTYVGNLNAGTA